MAWLPVTMPEHYDASVCDFIQKKKIILACAVEVSWISNKIYVNLIVKTGVALALTVELK